MGRRLTLKFSGKAASRIAVLMEEMSIDEAELMSRALSLLHYSYKMQQKGYELKFIKQAGKLPEIVEVEV